ncbi:hypothetical protein ACQKWADRAFT_328145 [Trichoderma austrokoningii]
MKRWRLRRAQVLRAALPELGDSQVLSSHRDLTLARGELSPRKQENVIPGSDDTGAVVAIGKQISRFQPGDKVVTMFNQGHLDRDLTPMTFKTSTGGILDGVFRSYGAFSEHALVRVVNFNSSQASTLYQWVLVQGTGGMSIFALQAAKAAGALTGCGVDIIVQVDGVSEMEQSIEAIKMCGTGERDELLEMPGQDVHGATGVCGRVQMKMIEAIDERVFKLSS